MVTLDELVDEVGVDATRFWMLMRSIDTTLDFDVDLAKQKMTKTLYFMYNMPMQDAALF